MGLFKLPKQVCFAEHACFFSQTHTPCFSTLVWSLAHAQKHVDARGSLQKDLGQTVLYVNMLF